MSLSCVRSISVALAISGLCLAASGCGLMDMGRETAKLFKPRPHDPGDAKDLQLDKWSSVGRDGRGDQRRVKESDGLTPYLQSEQSRQIERNLGID